MVEIGERRPVPVQGLEIGNLEKSVEAEAPFLERDPSLPSNYQMVKQLDVQQLAGLANLARNAYVLRRGRRIT